MTMLDRIKNESKKQQVNESVNDSKTKVDSTSSESTNDSSEATLTNVESQFKNILAEFNANVGFGVGNQTESPVDTMVEILSSKDVMVSLTVLLSYIRYCVNHGIKKDINVKIGYNKPPSSPMNFAINEEMLEDIYPGDTIEIN